MLKKTLIIEIMVTCLSASLNMSNLRTCKPSAFAVDALWLLETDLNCLCKLAVTFE